MHPSHLSLCEQAAVLGAGRVEDTLHLLGHALRKAVGLAAQELGTSAEAIVADAGRGRKRRR